MQLEAEDWRLRSTTRVVLANSVVRGGVISRCSFISRGVRVQFILIVLVAVTQDRTFNCWSRHRSSYTSQHTPLIMHHSPYTTHHTPLNIHHSSFITCHTHLIIQDSSYIVSEFKTDFTFKFGFHSVRCGPHPWQVVVAGCVSSLAGGTHTLHTWNPVGQKSGARAFDWRTRMLERTWTLL